MKTSTMLWLGVGTLAAVGLAVLVTRSGPPAPPAAAAEGAALFPDLRAKADAVTAIVVRRARKDTVVEKRGTEWVLPEKGGYPVPTDRVRDAFASLLEARILATKTSKPDLYAKLGVEDPDADKATSTLVTLRGADGGTVASVIVGRREWGDPSAGGDEGTKTFVRRAGEAVSYQVKGDFRIEADAMNWVDRGVTDLRNERVRAVTVTHPPAGEGQPPQRVHVSRATPDAKDFALEGKPAERKLKDDFVLSRLAYALSSVSMDDVGPAGSVDTSGPDAVAADFECFDGLGVHVRLVKKDGKTWATFRARAGAPWTKTEPPAAPPPEAAPKDDAPRGQGDEQPAAQPVTPPPVTPPPVTPQPVTPPPTATAATPAPGAAEALAKEVAELNAKWGPWVYQLPDWMATVLLSRPEDLLAAPPKDEKSATPEPASPRADDPGPNAPD